MRNLRNLGGRAGEKLLFTSGNVFDSKLAGDIGAVMDPKQQHYIPRHYLRNFCSPDSPTTIVTYEKSTGRVFRPNIGKIAREKGFYLPEIESGLAIEVEGPGNEILTEILKGQSLTKKEKALFSLYIAFLVKRVPAYRRKIDSIMLDTTREEMAKIQSEIDNHLDDPIVRAQRQREMRDLQDEWRGGLPEGVQHYIKQPWMTEGIPGAIFSMPWHYFLAKEGSMFATGDNPVFWFEALGLGNKYSELSIPLSSKVCLVATRAEMEDQKRVNAKEKIVKEINRRAAHNATRHVFYHEEVDWMRKLAIKGSYPDLKRIYIVPKGK